MANTVPRIRRCTECGGPLTVARKTAPYPESGLPNVVLVNVPVWKCVNGHEEIEIPAMRELHDVLVHQILRKPAPLTGAEIRFLRKRVGLSSKEFGARLGFHQVTVSKLETGRHRLQRPTDLLIRLYCAHLLAAKRGLQMPDDMLPVLEELERGMDVGQHRFEHLESNEPADSTPAAEWRPVNA